MDHRHEECRNPEPGCINCIRALRPREETRHKARSNLCPIKKRILQRKRDEKYRDQSTRREETAPQVYEDAPAPAGNAWGSNDRSQSRGRGRGSSRGRRGRGSVGRQPAPAAAPAAPAPPQQPPAANERTYPDLALNRRERNRRKRQNQQGNQQQQGNAQEQRVRVSAPETADNGVPAVRAPPTQTERIQQPMEVQESSAPAPTFAAATTARKIQPVDQPCAINIILTACHQHNMVRPGEFESKARYLLQKNLGVSVDLGNDWHSAEYIKLISGAAPTATVTQCSCSCQCKQGHHPGGARPKTTILGPQGVTSARTETSPVIQPAPLPSPPPRPPPPLRPSPPPYPLTANVVETVLVDDMDTQTQGAKRARTVTPDSSPTEAAAAKRINTVQSPSSPPVVTTISQEHAEQLGDLLVSVPETGAVMSLASLQEELSIPQGKEGKTPVVDLLSPLSPDNNDVFADAEEEQLPQASAPLVPSDGGSQAVSKTVPDSTLMPPPSYPPSVPAVTPRQRLRSSSTPRTPTKCEAPPQPPQGQTPLKRTSSQRSIAKPFPAGPTYSQLDRALEEAMESDSSVGSNSSTRGRKERYSRRERKHSRSGSSRGSRSKQVEGAEMNPVSQCIVASEVARSCIEITTADEKTMSKLQKNISHYKMAELIKLWRKDVITLEIKPRIPTSHAPEPDWRRRKYEGITSTLYERKINESEWLKYDGSLHLILNAPRLVSAAKMKKKLEDSHQRLKRCQELYKNGNEFVSWLNACPSPPRKNGSQLTAPKMDSLHHKDSASFVVDGPSGAAPIADDLRQKDQDFFDADSQDENLITASADPSGWTQEVPSTTTPRNSYTNCF